LCLDKLENDNKSVSNVARHLRNSISHYSFVAFDNLNKEISRVKFEDFKDESKILKTFDAVIPIANLRKFIHTFLDEMSKTMKGV